MNSIYRNIVVTTEIPENFGDKKLPVLDFKCWVEARTTNQPENMKQEEPRQRLLYTFFSKEMSSKYAIMRTSALPENMKVKSLSNDLIRQMKNVSELIGQDERNKVVDTYSIKLHRSGYKREAIKKMMLAGLSGYEKIRQLEKDGKTRIHRSAKSSLSNRYRKKLLGKSTWFQDKKDKKKLQGKKTPNKSSQKPREKSSSKNESSKEHEATATTTVLFVPQTPFGNLAYKLREAEVELFKLCGTKVKIVERAGTSLKSLLSRPNPWGNIACSREKCLTCKTEKNEGFCTKRSLTYETRCLSCAGAGREKLYIGETARSSYERGAEHQHDYKTKKADSHMHLHADEAHGGEEKPKFSMKILRCHKSPMYRQIHEAILIAKYEPVTLNAKNEYNRCLLPRLAIMMGEAEDRNNNDDEEDHPVLEDLETNNKRKENPPIGPRIWKRRKLNKEDKRSLSRMSERNQFTPAKRRLGARNEDSPSKRSRFDVSSLYEKSTPAPAFFHRDNSKKTKPASEIFSEKAAKTEPMKSTKTLVNFYEKLNTKKTPKRSSTAAAKTKSNLTQPKITHFTVIAQASSPKKPPDPTKLNISPTITTTSEATAKDVPPKMQLIGPVTRTRESESLEDNHHPPKISFIRETSTQDR